MKKTFLLMAATIFMQQGFAQKRYFTKTGTISFRAGTSVEDIDGLNKSTTAVFDAGTGQIEFAVLIKGFEFNSALMMEHFNENYMESDRYPKSVFKGTIVNIATVNFQKDGTYPVTVKGVLEIHGIKKEIETTGSIKISGESVASNAVFNVALEDYHISIPGIVKDKISKEAKVTVNCKFEILK